MNSKIACRLCFENISEEADRINLVDGALKENNILTIVAQHYGIEIKIDSGYSSSMCMGCWTITHNFHNLYELVKRNEARYESSSHFDDNHIEIKNSENHKSESVPPRTSERTTNGVRIEVTPSIKVESEYESDSSSKSFTDNPNTDGTSKKTNRKKRNEKFEQENQRIRDFFSMNCEMCDIQFGSVNEAKLHYRQNHNRAGYLSCCGKKFFNRIMALDHIQKHQNPEHLKCELCNKTYSTTYVLRNHMLSHGSEYTAFSCSICLQKFINKKQMSHHMRRIHLVSEEKNFGCDICGKFYVSKRVLSNHIRGVHEHANDQICHVCARTFKSKQVYKHHLLEHSETEQPKLQCNICGAWLKNDRGLRMHLIRHTEKEVRCTICNKLTPNKRALESHMRYVHIDAKHKCTICDKSFKKPIRLTEHMASHTGVDLYACPYCGKTFKSGANMHSHRKKEHFELWKQDRHQRYLSRSISTDNPS